MKPKVRLNRSVSQNCLANYGCSSDFQLNEDKMTIKNRLEFKLEEANYKECRPKIKQKQQLKELLCQKDSKLIKGYIIE